MMPVVPDGTDLNFYVNALQYLRGKRTKPFQRKCIIWRAKMVSEKILGDGPDPFQVLMKFTTLPLVLETLHDPIKKVMLQMIFSADSDEKVASSVGSLMPRMASKYRRCPCCVSEDLFEYGLSFGRSLHQLAVVSTCYKHGVALEDECLLCGAEFDYLLRRAPFRCELHVCYRCKSTSGKPLPNTCSSGYKAFVELLAHGMEGSAPEVGPPLLKVALDRFAELTLEHEIELLPIFARFWGCDDWRDVCSLIGVEANELYGALMFGNLPRNLILIYALTSFYHSDVVNSSKYPSGLAANIPIWNFEHDHRDWCIRVQAYKCGIPMHVVYLLLIGNRVAVRDLGFEMCARAFIETLDVSQQYILEIRRREFLEDRRRVNIGLSK